LLLTSFDKAEPVGGELFLNEHSVVGTVLASAALNALVYACGAVGGALWIFCMLGFVFNVCHFTCFILTYTFPSLSLSIMEISSFYD